jgi:hypothetical protein
MPAKAKAKPKRRPARRGAGFFGDVWSGLKTGYNVLKGIQPSRFIGLIPHPGAQGIASGLKTVGLGRKRRRTTVRRGGSLQAVAMQHGIKM